jgi:acetyl-CoA carboxylase biotin carboxyl carrier protein
MNWAEYKARCNAPAAFSRWMLEQTVELVADDEAVALPLRAALAGPILEQPADHRGGADTDMFELRLDRTTVERVVQKVADAAARGATTTGTARRGLGGFTAAWDEYNRFLARAAATDESAIEQRGEGIMAEYRVSCEVTGSVWKIAVDVGDVVATGDVLIILESMKMEIPLESPVAGRVTALLVTAEQAVAEGDVLVIVST